MNTSIQPIQDPLAVAYFSNVTNNTHTFVTRLGWEDVYRIPVKGVMEPLLRPYVLFVPSYGTTASNHVPPQVKKWLADEATRNVCVGVIGFGNLNFGPEYCWAGASVAAKLQVPYLHSVDLAGNTDDLDYVTDLLQVSELFPALTVPVLAPHHTPELAARLADLTTGQDLIPV